MPHNLKGKVLIVDDDPDDMQALVELLSLEGHMSEPDEKRFFWRIFLSELIGTALLVIVSLSVVIFGVYDPGLNGSSGRWSYPGLRWIQLGCCARLSPQDKTRGILPGMGRKSNIFFLLFPVRFTALYFFR